MADPKLGSTNYNVVQLDGQNFVINSITVKVLLRDNNGDVLWCSGTTVPTAGSAGYAISAIFTSTGMMWQNSGTRTSSTFVPITTVI